MHISGDYIYMKSISQFKMIGSLRYLSELQSSNLFSSVRFFSLIFSIIISLSHIMSGFSDFYYI